MSRFLKSFLVGFLIFPSVAQAKVYINEVAWMGTEASSNDEWVELFNPGDEEIDLTGWTIEAEDGTPSILLEGKITGGGYFLLERTDDSTVSNILADQIYTGALENGGEKIILKDAQGNIIDQIEGTQGWPAGDNATKATMERDLDFLGWHTFDKQQVTRDRQQGKDAEGNLILGTPRAENSPKVMVEIPEQEINFGEATSSSEEQETGPALQEVEPPTQKEEATVQIGVFKKGQLVPADQIIVPTQEIITLGVIQPQQSSEYQWNLGTGLIKSGPEISYQYSFPGKYIVSVQVLAKPEMTDQIKVIVYSQGIYISEFLPDPKGNDAEGEWIEIGNRSSFVVDLGGFSLDDIEGGSKPFLVPPGTFIFPGQFLVLSRAVTGLALNNDEDQVRLLSPAGQVLEQVFYKEPQQGQSAARQGPDFVWTAHPTPGFENVVNPELSQEWLSSTSQKRVANFSPRQVNLSDQLDTLVIQKELNFQGSSLANKTSPKLLISPSDKTTKNLNAPLLFSGPPLLAQARELLQEPQVILSAFFGSLILVILGAFFKRR